MQVTSDQELTKLTTQTVGLNRGAREGVSLNKRPNMARSLLSKKFGEELLLLALKGEAQSGWPGMILLLFHLFHLINFRWQVLNKVI